ncbi:hypothetical protein GTP41_02840 [Pseudoduganella sp. DS3]|uniref:Radical SAM protein n=1 Tax=Pseudoduganella guangdongensis TaxID=2692179 RepID=A0A6N9HCQ7_9BURK|nr:hypothetical protein [Pseudoduganella guangdongensis]
MSASLFAAPVLAALSKSVPTVAFRAPDPADDERWRRHNIGGRVHRIAQPVTFTPYASAQPCSARCRFCSETLLETGGGRPSSALRPGPGYFAALERALEQLRGLPLSYSLSGLETTDDAAWMGAMLDILAQHAALSPVLNRVLYTNGAGLAVTQQGEALTERLAGFGLDWLELSRHHFDAATNQSIMRFRPGVQVQYQQAFSAMVRRLAGRLNVKLVCIIQDGGVAQAEAVLRYLEWAHALGVRSVIFREFSKLDESYKDNVTARYIGKARISMDGLLAQCLATAEFADSFVFEQVTEGYYFWNLIGRLRDMQVTFEASDYSQMHRQHGSGDVYKLVFHANGNLCADWNPERHVLLAGETTIG